MALNLAHTGVHLVVDQEGKADRLCCAVRDFLDKLDSGYFGDLRIGGAESAFIADLRIRLAAFESLRIGPGRAVLAIAKEHAAA